MVGCGCLCLVVVWLGLVGVWLVLVVVVGCGLGVCVVVSVCDWLGVFWVAECVVGCVWSVFQSHLTLPTYRSSSVGCRAGTTQYNIDA